MPQQQLFKNLNNAINAQKLPDAVKAANAILRHYRLNRYATNASNMNRIRYALRLHNFNRQFGNAAHNLTNDMLWNIIRRP